MLSSRLPVFFLSHGGGPWPYLHGDARSHFRLMEAALKDIPLRLSSRPRGILVVSGHWEEREFSISSAPKPGMVYDYYGFPEHTYQIVYPAPGSPVLAARTRELLAEAGWHARMDDSRGFDHGAFSVLQPMFPQADAPVVQLSLKNNFDAAEHLTAGRALAPLRSEGILIIASGMSYHNLRLLGPDGAEPSAAFDSWLRQVLLESTPQARWQALIDWREAPSAGTAHPREDHLLPLMVAAGAAESDPATRIYSEAAFFGHLHISSYGFGCES